MAGMKKALKCYNTQGLWGGDQGLLATYHTPRLGEDSEF